MKFVDKSGIKHDSYVESVTSSAFVTVSNFLTSKFHKTKKNSVYGDVIDFEDDIDDVEENDDIEIMEDNGDMNIPKKGDSVEKGRDDLFIPGTTPKIPCNKKNVVAIDYDNNQLLLKDEDGNTIHTTNIDRRLMSCPVKDLINMVYDIKDENDEVDENK